LCPWTEAGSSASVSGLDFKIFPFAKGKVFECRLCYSDEVNNILRRRAEKRASALAKADKQPALKPAAAHGDLKKVRLVRPTKKQAAKGQMAVTIKCPGLRK
jgi:hypothetical protein